MKFNWKYTIIGTVILMACLFGVAVLVGEGSDSSSASPSNVQPSNAVDSAYSL